MDAEPIRVGEWATEARERTTPEEFLPRAVDLALMLVQALAAMVAAEAIEVEDITVDNVLVFVERPRAPNGFFGGATASPTDGAPSVKAVNFQCEPPLPFAQSEPLSASAVCAALGRILLEIFSSGGRPGPSAPPADSRDANAYDGPAVKRAASVPIDGASKSLAESGMPHSICQLVGDLLGGGKAPVTSLDEAISDLAQMKEHPGKYLWDRTSPEKALGDTCLFGGTDAPFLCGRQREMNTLIDSIQRISTHVAPNDIPGSAPTNGTAPHGFLCEAVFLSGYAGSGKSSLIRPVVHSCSLESWFVINCQFDKQVSSAACLAKAFDDFFAKWAQLSDATFDKVCHFIFDAIDFEAFNQLCDQIPNLSSVLPKIFPFLVAKAQGTTSRRLSLDVVGAAANRRLFLYRMLFMALSCSGRQVLVVLEDLHWAEKFVLECLAESGLRREECRRGMLVVGSYRSNEMPGDSGVMQEINSLKRNANVTLLPVGELSTENVHEMVSAILCTPKRYTRDLAAMAHRKTRGNPFFVVQFLRTIISNKMLQFSVKSRRWSWDCDVIDMQLISEGVAELLTSTFELLPPPLIATIQIVSCFGTQVSESTFEAANAGHQLLAFDVRTELRSAVRESILEKAGPIYQFTHDVIQSTIYDGIPLTLRNVSHKMIGLNLLQSAENHPSVHLLATDQINLFCDSGSPSPDDRPLFAQTNATAAKHAIAASSFERARSYVDAGIRLLDADHWEKQYTLSLELFELSASVASMRGNIAAIRIALDELVSNAKSFEDGLTSNFLQCKLLAASSKHTEAISNGVKMLSGLGEAIPQDVTLPLVMNKLSLALPLLRNLTTDKVKSLPEMTLVDKMHAMKFLALLCTYSVVCKPILLPLFSCKMLKLTLEYGRCDDSIVGIVMAGHSALALMEDLALCRHVSKVVEPLIEESPKRNALRARCAGFELASRVIAEPAQASLSYLPERYNEALIAGDMESALKFYQYYCILLFHTGAELGLVTKHLKDCILKASSCQQNSTMYIAMSFLNATTFLLGKDSDVNVLSYDELEALGEERSNNILLHHNVMNRMSGCFWMNDYESVEKLSNKVQPSQHKRISRYHIISDMKSIASLQLARTTRSDVERRRSVGEKAVAFLMQMEEVSKWNFSNKACLVQACLFHLDGQLDAAELAYTDAITAAREHKFIHEEANALELYGRFLIESRLEFDEGEEQLTKALERYKQWGATRKVLQLQLDINGLDSLGD